MKQFLFFVLLIIFALSITVSAKEIDININGVGLGTSQPTVLRKLGTPLQSKKGEFSECGGGYYKTLTYSGLVIDLLSDDEGKNYTVVSIEVTSSKWSVASGISIGADTEKVQNRFGQPLDKANNFDDKEIWYYVNKGNNGFTNFFFQDDKLVEIRWKSVLC